MRKKQLSITDQQERKAIKKWLRTFPVFKNGTPAGPLGIGIHRNLYDRNFSDKLGFKNRNIYAVLYHMCNTPEYLRFLSVGKIRFSLYRHPLTRVTARAAEQAQLKNRNQRKNHGK